MAFVANYVKSFLCAKNSPSPLPCPSEQKLASKAQKLKPTIRDQGLIVCLRNDVSHSPWHKPFHLFSASPAAAHTQSSSLQRWSHHSRKKSCSPPGRTPWLAVLLLQLLGNGLTKKKKKDPKELEIACPIPHTNTAWPEAASYVGMGTARFTRLHR